MSGSPSPGSAAMSPAQGVVLKRGELRSGVEAEAADAASGAVGGEVTFGASAAMEHVAAIPQIVAMIEEREWRFSMVTTCSDG